jgi:hypothetical protein
VAHAGTSVCSDLGAADAGRQRASGTGRQESGNRVGPWRPDRRRHKARRGRRVQGFRQAGNSSSLQRTCDGRQQAGVRDRGVRWGLVVGFQGHVMWMMADFLGMFES